MRCLNCEFYNQPDAPFCLDCGAEDFTDESLFGEGKEDSSRMVSLKFVFVSTFVITLAVIFITLTDNPDNLYSNLFYAVTFGFFGSLLVSIVATFSQNFVSDRNKRQQELALSSKVTLTSMEDEINYKLHLLIEENTDLINLFAPVDEEDEADGIEYVETNEAEKQLYETVEAQSALCQLQLNEIDLIRLEGEIFYCRENLNVFVEKEAAENIETIENLFERLEYLEDTSELDENNGYLNLFSVKQKIFLEKIEAARKHCENVRDELIEKRDALRGQATYLSPSPTNTPSGEQGLAVQELADYDVKRILNDYSPTFGELESEYNRLKPVETKQDKSVR